MSAPPDPSDPRDPREPRESSEPPTPPSVDPRPSGPASSDPTSSEPASSDAQAPDPQAPSTRSRDPRPPDRDGGGETAGPTGPAGVPGSPGSPGSASGRPTPGPSAGTGADRDEDALWRAIVENYGERARLDPDPPGGTEARGSSSTGGPAAPLPPRPARPSTRPSSRRPGAGDPRAARDLSGGADLPEVPPSLRDLDGPAHREPPEDGEHFVPPPPPPVPLASPPRLLAWIGLFGVPLLVLVALVIGRPLPSWLGLLLTLWFVGGFVFLVVSMRPGQRDEDDDGAVL